MRDMTKEELRLWYRKGQWPCGHGNEYLEGPQGGLSVNVECPTCHMKLNVIDPQSGIPWPTGQVIYEPPGYVQPVEPVKPWWKRVFGIAS